MTHNNKNEMEVKKSCLSSIETTQATAIAEPATSISATTNASEETQLLNTGSK